jgi:hypothetical protein
MLGRCWALVRSSLWPLLTVHALADAAVFLLHRLSHRLTNEVAVAVLLGGALSPAAIGNMWWLSVDPKLANFQTGAWRGPAQSMNGSYFLRPFCLTCPCCRRCCAGYQPLTFLFFIATFPLVVAVKSWATLATILVCREAEERLQQQQAGADSCP